MSLRKQSSQSAHKVVNFEDSTHAALKRVSRMSQGSDHIAMSNDQEVIADVFRACRHVRLEQRKGVLSQGPGDMGDLTLCRLKALACD